MHTRRCTRRSPSRSRARPATERSRSNQVCHRPPPYVSTFSMRKPHLAPLDTGFSFRQGLHRAAQRYISCLPHLLCCQAQKCAPQPFYVLKRVVGYC